MAAHHGYGNHNGLAGKTPIAGGPKKSGGRRARRGRFIGAALVALFILLASAFALIRLWPTARETVLSHYPVKYESEIRAASAEFGLQPAYVASVILAESSFNPTAVSRDDARGLMQILPSTGGWIAEKLSETLTDEMLFDPATNIRYGCWYLNFLLDRYGGDMKCASAAYHAGQGTVDKWLSDPQLSADGITLDTIAYPATNTYVDRVLNNYEHYVEIFKGL